MAWTDSHCHLQFDGVGLAALGRAREQGVTRVICVGTDAATSAAAIELSREHAPAVHATVGLHPHEAAAGIDTLLGLFDAPEVVAVGECGLDYYYEHSPREVQREVFARQVHIARKRNLALVVHTRDAWDDTIAVLGSEGVPERTVIHCFSGGAREAQRCLDLGAALSFSGIVTFKRAEDVRDAARICPGDRLLVETDAPYLAPVPHRGKTNEPAFVSLVGEAIARLRDEPVEIVQERTWDNASRLFGLVS